MSVEEDFKNAAKRHLIKMYDFHRSENYDCENCKHVACSEVRAAQFNSKCNPRERSSSAHHRLSRMTFQTNTDKIESNEFCMRDVAVARLMEKEKCAAKAEKYVDYVFQSCRSDHAPFT